jgi:AcrR family transcriptional regulator
VTRSVPPRRWPAARRRTQLLDVALQLFGAQGFRATSMEGIAEAAGVTKPVLYPHFPSKAQLYLELIETVGHELLEAVTAAATAETLPYHRVRAGFSAYFRFVDTRTNAFQLLFGGGARDFEGAAEAVRQVEASIAATIADLIDVDLEAEHRDLLGFAIVGLAEVSSRQWVRRRLAPVEGELLASAEGELLAGRLADLVWAGLRGLPSRRGGPVEDQEVAAPPTSPP